jgi:chromosome segregation ATPase
MRLLEWFRRATPLGLPILASIAAVVLLAEGYSVSLKLENYERLRADHETLIQTIAEKNHERDKAAANLEDVKGKLKGANAERDKALEEKAVAGAAKASIDVERRQAEKQKTALLSDIETKKTELGEIEKSITAADQQLANKKRDITSEQARLADAQAQTSSETDKSTRLKRLTAGQESRLAELDKSISDDSSRLAGLQRDAKEAQGVIDEATTLRGQIMQFRKERETAESELLERQERRTALQLEIARLQSQSSDLSTQISQRKTDLSDLDQKNRALRDQVSAGEAAIRDQFAQQQRERAAKTAEINQLTERITVRQNDLALLEKAITDAAHRRDAPTAEPLELEQRRGTVSGETDHLDEHRRQLNDEKVQSSSDLLSNPFRYWK